MFTNNRRYIRISNPVTPQRVLVHLSKDPDSGVRWAVASNPNTPNECLQALTFDSVGFVREQALKTLTGHPAVAQQVYDYIKATYETDEFKTNALTYFTYAHYAELYELELFPDNIYKDEGRAIRIDFGEIRESPKELQGHIKLLIHKVYLRYDYDASMISEVLWQEDSIIKGNPKINFEDIYEFYKKYITLE